ncbi:MAG: hypothetical protein BWY31_03413 [Lentisphaerae bacterium ADurb.Bin242]|nr:MAG: hypothetical protein BWY31_03413 [Lentisphaerae bacterium ADurb.Bin242]
MNKKWTLTLLSGLTLELCARNPFQINNQTVTAGFEEGNDSWTYSRSVDFTKPEGDLKEFLLEKSGWKQHPKHAGIRGYNGEITLKIKAPGPIAILNADATMCNYADSVRRKLVITYSLNGSDFTELASKEFGGGSGQAAGEVKLPVNRGILWLRFGRKIEEKDTNGKHGFVLFQKLSVRLSGTFAQPEKGTEKITGVSRELKNVFPTGVFWAWERTAPNAEYAKMEFWPYVEFTMKTLRDNGYDTCWFVNFPVNEQARVLNLAEKHGLRVLFNTDLLDVFYNGAGSLDCMDRLAERTAVRLGDFPALLGYVLKDEPLLPDLETCNYLYRLMKKFDPSRDSVAVVMNRQSMTFLRESVLPVVCSDIYYFGNEKSTQLPAPRPVSQKEFTNALNSFGTAAELYGKHSWFMGQMFGDVWGRHWRKGDKMIVEPGSYLHWKMPTEAESRWQVWEALRLGSKGILFYVLHPPIPLEVPPAEAKEPRQLKEVEKMDKSAKTAAGWKNQPLTGKQVEIDPGEGMVEPGGKPTKQMLATAPAMKLIRKNEALLVQRKKADFPVFFANDAQTDVSTFISSDRWLGVVVNRDLDHKRTVSVLVPNHVTKVVNLETGKSLTLARENADFRKFPLELEAGGGALFEAEFAKQPGMAFCRESFDQNSIHRLAVNKNAEIFHHGGYGADANRSLRLKGDPGEPVCVLLNLTNPKGAQRTFSVNLNARKKDGTVFCKVNGRLTNAMVKAVSSRVEGESANVMHLQNLAKGEVKKAEKSTVIQDKDFFRPAAVPVGTTALEFYLNDPKDYIEDITVWFIPE